MYQCGLWSDTQVCVVFGEVNETELYAFKSCLKLLVVYVLSVENYFSSPFYDMLKHLQVTVNKTFDVNYS